MSESDENQDWMCHGWDDHIRGQLEHTRTLTFRQRLEWLEDMAELANRLARDPAWPGRKSPSEGRSWILNEPPDTQAPDTQK